MRLTPLILPLTLAAGCSYHPETVEADPGGGWRVDCEVTGRGDPTGEEGFSAGYLSSRVDRGARVDREFEGRRLALPVLVRRPARGVAAGRYTLYGTVTGVDAADGRVRMTDCVFTPKRSE